MSFLKIKFRCGSVNRSLRGIGYISDSRGTCFFGKDSPSVSRFVRSKGYYSLMLMSASKYQHVQGQVSTAWQAIIWEQRRL